MSNDNIKNVKSYANSASDEIIRLREENNRLKQDLANLREELASVKCSRRSSAVSAGRQKKLRDEEKTPLNSISRNLLYDNSPSSSINISQALASCAVGTCIRYITTS